MSEIHLVHKKRPELVQAPGQWAWDKMTAGDGEEYTTGLILACPSCGTIAPINILYVRTTLPLTITENPTLCRTCYAMFDIKEGVANVTSASQGSTGARKAS